MNEILKRLEAYYVDFLEAIPRIGLAILILVIGIFIVSWLTSLFQKRIRRKSYDPLMSTFLAKAIKLVLIIFVFLFALHAAGLSGIAGAILATAGASAVVLGFAFKDIAENFLAGIILAFNRPFHVNDTVEIENVFGKVKTMEFRYTKIATFDGRNVYIPNSDILTKPVFNYTEDGFYRTDFVVGIAYENDIEKAKEIITSCFIEIEEIVKDIVHVNFVAEHELAASTVNLKVFFWVTTEDFRRGTLQTRGKLIQKVKSRLEENGFNLPADIRELKFYEASKPFQIISTEEGNTDNVQ
ncbi:MAG: mechanosensitive ion channel [Bacteroidota bacterium]|nr:mechanosensitive ion channel [Nitrosopumilus sp.]MDQ3052131.1 mechanosensitive ion channel [Bacteroidota bacterium]